LAVRPSSFKGFSLAFSGWFAPVTQLSAQSLVLGSKLRQLLFHPFHAGPKLSRLSFHPPQMGRQNLSYRPAHPFRMSGDDLSQLSFHLLEMGLRSSGIPFFSGPNTPALLVTAKALCSPGLRPFSGLPRIPPGLFANGHPSFPLRSFFGTVTRPPGLHARHPVVSAFGHEGNRHVLAFLQPASCLPEVLIFPGYEHGHMVVALKRLDDDAHHFPFALRLLDEPDERAAHRPVSAAVLGPEQAAEHERRKHHQHEHVA
jgi:hypothetical protein